MALLEENLILPDPRFYRTVTMNLGNATIGQLMIPVDGFDCGVAFYTDVLGALGVESTLN
jgi:hypothetical protein